MTADLLLAPPTVTAPVEAPVEPERVTCGECFEPFPRSEAEFYEPLQEWRCLDDLAAELQRADDRRDRDNYYYG